MHSYNYEKCDVTGSQILLYHFTFFSTIGVYFQKKKNTLVPTVRRVKSFESHTSSITCSITVHARKDCSWSAIRSGVISSDASDWLWTDRIRHNPRRNLHAHCTVLLKIFRSLSERTWSNSEFSLWIIIVSKFRLSGDSTSIETKNIVRNIVSAVYRR